MLYIVEYKGNRYGVFASSYQYAEARVIENHAHMIPLP
jgi:hypothetical protein